MRFGLLRFAAPLVAAVALLAGMPSAAYAHTDHVVEPIDVENFGYAPADVTIYQTRSVSWRWRNSSAHSVTSKPSSPMQFDSGMHTQGDKTFVLRFDEPGTYEYSSGSVTAPIEGVVNVLPFPGKNPRIKNLRVEHKRGIKAVFGANKSMYVVGRVQERKGGKWKTRKTISRNAGKGRNNLKLPKKKLKPGRYRFKVTGYDRYRRQDVAAAKFRLR